MHGFFTMLMTHVFTNLRVFSNPAATLLDTHMLLEYPPPLFVYEAVEAAMAKVHLFNLKH